MPGELRTTPDETLVRPTLQISYDADTDVLYGLLPGVVADGHPEEEIDEVLEGFYLFHHGANGPVVGFCAADAFAWDVLGNVEEVLWGAGALRFDVPTLGLAGAAIGEIVLAAQQTLAGSTPDVLFFDAAVAAGEEDREDAERLWRHCLAAGDLKGHFGLGYTLVELGRPREAYGHLVTYTELTPALSWAWFWRGRAAEEMGELDDARTCYGRALDAEDAGSEETDAAERLAALHGEAA
jgi:tetratricopeptide (TPR) repeat protein